MSGCFFLKHGVSGDVGLQVIWSLQVQSTITHQV